MTGVQERSQVWTPILAASTVAWMVLAFQPMPTFCSISMMQTAELTESISALNLLTSFAADWALMLAAMMLPSLSAPIRYIRDHSFTHRRARSIAFFLVGYSAVWVLAGGALLALATAIQRSSHGIWVPAAVVFVIAVIWQCSPLKQRCLNRNHAHTELSAFGWAADLGALRFGGTHGFWCFGSCWALMLLTMVVPSHQLACMFAVALWLFAERLERPMPLRWSFRGPSKAVRLIVAQSRLRLQRNENAMP